MPSASVSMSSVLPSCTSVWISAAEPFDPAMPLMNERSIFRASTGNWRR